MIPYSFHPEARSEYSAAALYYASRRPGLGDSFADAVEHALSLIREYPELGSPVEGSARRFLVRKFPYALIYRVEAGALHIVAIANLRREPGYWRHRE